MEREKEDKECVDSQFAPFLDELIDSVELSTCNDQIVQLNGRQIRQDTNNVHGNKHILREISIVKGRIGFDEQDFRDRCQKTITELSQEFKGFVDQVYDMLETLINEHSKALYQMQIDSFKNYENTLSKVRRACVQSGKILTMRAALALLSLQLAPLIPFGLATIEQSVLNFVNQMQQAYRNAFDD